MSKPSLLVLTALLLAALPASAADTPQPVPAPPAATLAAAGAPGPTLCQATLSPLAAPPLLRSSARSAGQTLPILCGSCSTPLCAGKPVGVICEQNSFNTWHCLTPPDTACTSDGNDYCICTTRTF
jgi:hypothetical protein